MPFVTCKDHQYRDPKTNRCRNNPDYKHDRTPAPVPAPTDGDPNGKFKPCKDHQYRDPTTNRCI